MIPSEVVIATLSFSLRPNKRLKLAARRLRNGTFFSAPQLKTDPLASHLVLRGALASSLSILHSSERSLVRQSVCRASFCIDPHPWRLESRRGMFSSFHAFKCKPVIGTRS